MCFALLSLSCARAQQPPARAATAALTVTATTLDSAPLARSISASGGIFAWQEIIVGPEVGGYRVAAVNVDVGDRVRKGQELVRLSSDLLDVEVAARRASLRQTQADFANADAALRRGTAISTSGALSAADLDRLKAEQLSAQARVQTSEADLKTSELRLRYTRVTSPDDGIVTARSVNVGEIAQTGGEMLRVLRKGRVEWRAEIPEALLHRVKAGQTVRVSTIDGVQLEGEVRAVAPTLQTSNRTGLVYVDITTANNAARPGMFARGEITTGNEDAKLMPVAGVVVQDGYSYVYVLRKNDTVERRRVQTGTVRGAEIEITQGVTVGERVVVKGAGFLKDGDLVRVSDNPPATAGKPAN
ncbi:MAG: efflux RND transporter periplasmic adaptor subunit [Steroidobacteraceae bacterium]